MSKATPKIVQIAAVRDGVQGEPIVYALWSDGVLTRLGIDRSPTGKRTWTVIDAARIDKPVRGR